jgi:hypothetical protein
VTVENFTQTDTLDPAVAQASLGVQTLAFPPVEVMSDLMEQIPSCGSVSSDVIVPLVAEEL